METYAFIGVTVILAAASMWRRRFENALAFGAVTAGLSVMALIAGNAGGIVAFAVWTLVSYAVLNFPIAAMLYLVSAFCYILELQGHWMLAIQVASNLAGVAGLAVLWYGTPKWRYVGMGRSRHWGLVFVDFNTSRRDPRAKERSEEQAE